jgi:L-alanine-DL-glutamate epimerase-like enolase superfamily enzyme
MQQQLSGHPLEAGYEFLEHVLPEHLTDFNQMEMQRTKPATHELDPQAVEPLAEPMPWLAALVCNSAFDIALHDAFGKLAGKPVYETYGPPFLARDLASFLKPAESESVSFVGRHPVDFLAKQPQRELPAWHLVGGLDPMEPSDLTGSPPEDGYPVLLADWIRRDGLKCLKIKLRGNDLIWDFNRLVKVGTLAVPLGVEWLTADFNCTVEEASYVNDVLDELAAKFPELYRRLLYVEQPFPYELEQYRLDVHSVSARKPLFLDESAHDWRMVRYGRELG